MKQEKRQRDNSDINSNLTRHICTYECTYDDSHTGGHRTPYVRTVRVCLVARLALSIELSAQLPTPCLK